jgi:redox-sensing transcriptional repressor
MEKSKISALVIRRLPRYYRYLDEVMQKCVTKISSTELGNSMRTTASQIRQDLNCFGGFGQQGYGYNVASLHNEIGNILGLGITKKAIMIGAGNLGHALAANMDMRHFGFELVKIFDIKQSIIGQTIGGAQICHIDDLEEFSKQNKPEVAILTLPKTETQAMIEKLYSLGILRYGIFLMTMWKCLV